MDNKFLGIVDADSILYKVAFAAREEGLDEALRTLSAFVYQSIYKPTQCNYYIFCLSGGESGRDKIAVTKPYKGQRKAEKPEHLAELRQHMIDHFSALIVDDYEADDVVIALANRYNPHCILLGIDKDAKQLAGFHYNYNKDIHTTISMTDAHRHFFKQMLTGDTVDNIAGLPKVGDKKADKLFDDNPNVPPAYLVRKEYEERGYDYDYFEEQYKLLYMKRDIPYDYESHFIKLDNRFTKTAMILEEFDDD
jgi:hypothetical protein